MSLNLVLLLLFLSGGTDLLYARDIIPRPSPPPRVQLPSTQGHDTSGSGATPSFQAGPSNPKVKIEEALTVKKENLTGHKRTSDQAWIINLSSDDEDGDEINAAIVALSPEELIAFKNMKVGYYDFKPLLPSLTDRPPPVPSRTLLEQGCPSPS